MVAQPKIVWVLRSAPLRPTIGGDNQWHLLKRTPEVELVPLFLPAVSPASGDCPLSFLVVSHQTSSTPARVFALLGSLSNSTKQGVLDLPGHTWCSPVSRRSFLQTYDKRKNTLPVENQQAIGTRKWI